MLSHCLASLYLPVPLAEHMHCVWYHGPVNSVRGVCLHFRLYFREEIRWHEIVGNGNEMAWLLAENIFEGRKEQEYMNIFWPDYCTVKNLAHALGSSEGASKICVISQVTGVYLLFMMGPLTIRGFILRWLMLERPVISLEVWHFGSHATSLTLWPLESTGGLEIDLRLVASNPFNRT
jgi:hypothetical protein